MDAFDMVRTYGTEETIVSLCVVVMMMAISFNFRRARKEMRKMQRKMLIALRGKTMTRKELEERMNCTISDIIYNGLVDAMLEGKITRAKFDKTLRQLANALYIPDMIVASKLEIPTHVTKEEFDLIQSILRSKKRMRQMVLNNKRSPIPGLAPGEDVKTISFDQALADYERATKLANQGLEEAKKLSKQKSSFGGKMLRTATA